MKNKTKKAALTSAEKQKMYRDRKKKPNKEETLPEEGKFLYIFPPTKVGKEAFLGFSRGWMPQFPKGTELDFCIPCDEGVKTPALRKEDDIKRIEIKKQRESGVKESEIKDLPLVIAEFGSIYGTHDYRLEIEEAMELSEHGAIIILPMDINSNTIPFNIIEEGIQVYKDMIGNKDKDPTTGIYYTDTFYPGIKKNYITEMYLFLRYQHKHPDKIRFMKDAITANRLLENYYRRHKEELKNTNNDKWHNKLNEPYYYIGILENPEDDW